jgi:2-polyprenyl-6-methoxyphenol hydroxylase-like FAD-dependent oxidoreductase
LRYEEGAESCTIYTARDNRELRVCFIFPAAPGEVPADHAGQVVLMRERCGKLGWEAPRLLEAMGDTPDFYLGLVGQMRMPGWTRSRVALLGDAGYCPSPWSGAGTSLALVGACVLAGELAISPDDHAAAFSRYETRMRPFVEKNQAIADLACDERISDPAYFAEVIEPAIARAQDAISLGIAHRRCARTIAPMQERGAMSTPPSSSVLVAVARLSNMLREHPKVLILSEFRQVTGRKAHWSRSTGDGSGASSPP